MPTESPGNKNSHFIKTTKWDCKALKDKASQTLRAKMSSKSKRANSWKGLYEEQELLKWVKRGKKIREGAGQEAWRQDSWVFFSNIS